MIEKNSSSLITEKIHLLVAVSHLFGLEDLYLPWPTAHNCRNQPHLSDTKLCSDNALEYQSSEAEHLLCLQKVPKVHLLRKAGIGKKYPT